MNRPLTLLFISLFCINFAHTKGLHNLSAHLSEPTKLQEEVHELLSNTQAPHKLRDIQASLTRNDDPRLLKAFAVIAHGLAAESADHVRADILYKIVAQSCFWLYTYPDDQLSEAGKADRQYILSWMSLLFKGELPSHIETETLVDVLKNQARQLQQAQHALA